MRFFPPRCHGFRLLIAAFLACCGLGTAHAAEPSPELKQVLGFVEKLCAGCHNDKDKKADLSLTGYRDELAIFKGYKTWGHVLQMVEAGEMPPKKKPRPTADETAAFVAGVKAVFKSAAASAKPDPGRVTVRRLNRFEYNNTIRDLVGIDFNAAEDFPADDIGHGNGISVDQVVAGRIGDQTRLASLEIGGEAGAMAGNCDSGYSCVYSSPMSWFIGVSEGHHDLSHHGNDAAKKEKIRLINKFHISQLAYLLQKLKSIPEGDGTLLDHCQIVYGSGNSDGNAHNHNDLPILLAGCGGGTLSTGRHVRYPDETPLANLWLSLLERMDVSLPYLGDSTGALKGLVV